MALNIYETQIPSLITWFNQFVGYREIQNRIERVESKLKEINFASPVFNRRYSFHITYKHLLLRNRRCQKIDVAQIENNRVLSTIASTEAMAKELSKEGALELRARIIESLSPDRDIRQLEHELRVFVHYKQAGLEVTPIFGKNSPHFDFLVKTPRGEFEVECKTFSEDIGYALTTEQSLLFFRAIKSAVGQSAASLESGIFTITLASNKRPTQNEICSLICDFIERSPQEKDYGAIRISFERKFDWDAYLRTGNLIGAAEELIARQQLTNPHAILMINNQHAILFCLIGERKPRPLVAILARLKRASKQFSKTRAAVLWAHLLAIDEEGFGKLLQPRKNGTGRFLDIFGQYLFRSENRKHVCRLRLSVDGASTSRLHRQLILPYRSNVILSGGPAYELVSRVSMFDPEITNW
jgi:hypothetical protein